jgi:uncharacterized protein
MLRIDRRELRAGPVETDATVSADDPLLGGLALRLEGDLAVSGRLQQAGHGDYLWRGRLAGTARAECRRCLAEVPVAIAADVDVLFSADPDAGDDPSVYPIAEAATHVDVGEAVREELALAVPPYVLCRDDCAGLCPRCGADLNAGPCGCTPAEPN